MGKYSVPELIRKNKPKGTMVKKIKDHYYVYNFKHVKINNKWKIKTEKMIGRMREDGTFIPNDNFNMSSDITVLEFGQYFLVISCSITVLEQLKNFFNPIDAERMYLMAIIHFSNKFTYLKNIKNYYDQSYLNIAFPNLKMGSNSLAKLLDSLGRRQTKVISFQQYLIDNSSGEIAIDGHVVACSSHENDLAEYGNKFRNIKEMQINVLMAYDVNNLNPLFSKVY